MRILKDSPEGIEFYKKNRKEYRKMVQQANRRWKNIEKAGLSSRAVDEAEAAGGKYFYVSQLKGPEGLAELVRLRNFLNDDTSTVKGAQYYQTTVVDVVAFREEWGESWEGLGDMRYNNYKETFEAEYGEEFTSRVYANYRRLEKEFNRLLQEGVLGEGFGSDNLITMMFDMAIKGVDDGFSMLIRGGKRKGEIRDEIEAPEFVGAHRMLEYFDHNYYKDEETSSYKRKPTKIDNILREGRQVYHDYIGQLYDF